MPACDFILWRLYSPQSVPVTGIRTLSSDTHIFTFDGTDNRGKAMGVSVIRRKVSDVKIKMVSVCQ